MSSVIKSTSEQEDALIARVRQGERAGASAAERSAARVARDELLALLHPLVEAIADRYAGSGLDRQELVKAGTEGVGQAVLHYRPTGAYKFSAYATWWIRTRIHQRLGLSVE